MASIVWSPAGPDVPESDEFNNTCPGPSRMDRLVSSSTCAALACNDLRFFPHDLAWYLGAMSQTVTNWPPLIGGGDGSVS